MAFPLLYTPRPEGVSALASRRRIQCRAAPHRCKGVGVLGWMLLVPVALVGLLVLAFVLFEGRKAYWDSEVREMCKKDGGVTVYQHITLDESEYKRLGGTQGGLPVPNENDKSDYPYFRRVIDTKIHDSNPQVMRSETLAVRRSDGGILGRSVQYWRGGGDFPTGLSEASSFVCPQQADLSRQIFKIEEKPR